MLTFGHASTENSRRLKDWFLGLKNTYQFIKINCEIIIFNQLAVSHPVYYTVNSSNCTWSLILLWNRLENRNTLFLTLTGYLWGAFCRDRFPNPVRNWKFFRFPNIYPTSTPTIPCCLLFWCAATLGGHTSAHAGCRR